MPESEGGEAGLAWERMISANVELVERNSLRAAFLAYCKLGTLAMVRLLEVLSAARFLAKAANRLAWNGLGFQNHFERRPGNF